MCALSSLVCVVRYCCVSMLQVDLAREFAKMQTALATVTKMLALGGGQTRGLPELADVEANAPMAVPRLRPKDPLRPWLVEDEAADGIAVPRSEEEAME